MQIVKKVTSRIDGTVKFVFELDDGLFSEISAIVRKNDRLAICVSTQTWCAQNCKFCHVTHSNKKQRLRNLTEYEMYSMVSQAINNMPKCVQDRDMLLVAYMGIGEPTENMDNVIGSSGLIRSTLEYKKYRFSIATMVPQKRLMELIKFAAELGSDTKIHYSLHSTDKAMRSVLMPTALDSEFVFPVLRYVRDYFSTQVEIHYTLINGINDGMFNIDGFSNLIDENIPVTFLQFSDCGGMHKTGEEQIENIMRTIHEYEMDFECYSPPGEDIGAICGQILIDDFLE